MEVVWGVERADAQTYTVGGSPLDPSFVNVRTGAGRPPSREEDAMQSIKITGVHYHLSDQAKAYITEKLGSLERLYPRLSSLQVTVHRSGKEGFRVDVDMHLPSGKDVIAHDTEDTLHAAIDVVADKCAAQLRKIHDREVEPQRMRA
jgi:ribosomal subunit interface protein